MNLITAVRLCIMMFIQFFLWGSWYVTAYLFLGKIGFGGGEIAWTYSVGPIAGMISPFFVGMIADRFFSTERVLGVLHLVGGGMMLLAITMMGDATPEPLILGETVIEIPVLSLTGTAASALVINLLFFGHMLCYFPTLALTNSLALHNMSDPEKFFPLIRVFGTVGWIVAGVFLSFQGWDSAVNLFYVAAFTAIIMGLYSFTLPHTPPPSKGKEISFSEIMGFDALVLFRRPAFLVFMLCSFLVCIPLAFYYQMAGKFIAQGGMANPAFKMSFGQMSEIFFMLLMPLFFARLGVKWMLFVGMLAWVARYALFAVGANDSVMWMLFGGIVLHGVCYDFFFVTGQIYTDRVAPKAIRSQAQGLLVLCTLGLGMLIGAQIAGQIEEAYTPPATARLQQEAMFVGHEQDERQEALEKDLKEVETSAKEEYEKITTELTKKDEAPSGFLAMMKDILATASDPVNDKFTERAAKATADTQKKIEAANKKIGDLQAKPAGDIPNQIALHGEQIERLELLDDKLETVAEEAESFAAERVAELESKPAADTPAAKLAVEHQTIERLGGYKARKSLEAEQAVDWRMIWMIPAVFAAVIMVIFALTFKDDGAKGDEVDEEDVAKAAAVEKQP